MDKFCEWSGKFWQSGLTEDFGDWTGRVEGNWRLVRNIKVRDLALLFMADGKKQGLTPFPVS